MSALEKPFAFKGSILNEPPTGNEWAEVVRVIGPVDVNIVGGGPIPVTIEQPPNSTVTAVAQSTSSVVLAAANSDRRGLAIYNNSNRVLFVRAATGAATVSNFTVRLNRNDYYELPFPVYTGVVTGIWASGSGGAAQVTEFTV
jgi:hypothetical protein